jgi:hypothetical protein
VLTGNLLDNIERICMNTWYKEAELARLQKEASLNWLKALPVAALLAINAVLAFSTLDNFQKQRAIDEAANRFKVDRRIVEKAINDPNISELDVEEAIFNTEIEEQPEPAPQTTNTAISIDDLVPHILHHEGLIDRQTPFRYTSDAMREWNTIHGFPIDRSGNVPNNRRNFIFLQRQEHVPMAVRAQFANYSNRPHAYGLQGNPTVEQAIRVFDQTGADGKLRYLRDNLPNFNPDQPLSELF